MSLIQTLGNLFSFIFHIILNLSQEIDMSIKNILEQETVLDQICDPGLAKYVVSNENNLSFH